MSEVIIDGVRYVPADRFPDEVRFYYMHDNHMFTRLTGRSLIAIVCAANTVEAESGYGMLCPATILFNGKEVRRVGTAVHSRGHKVSKDEWDAGVKMWMDEMKADVDVMRLMKGRKA